ncbi:DUF86 domain-containing protein [Bacteroidia bacterium]|nr:DUF86 domain-containing protein [Bacteroidia bacterium]
MREELRDRGRLQHMQEAIGNAFEFTNGLTFENYCTNKVLHFAVVKVLEIVGEAAYMLSKQFKAQHPEVEWHKIIAMRHVMVHGYYQIEDEEVWAIIHNDLPPLQLQINELLSQAVIEQ